MCIHKAGPCNAGAEADTYLTHRNIKQRNGYNRARSAEGKAHSQREKGKIYGGVEVQAGLEG